MVEHWKPIVGLVGYEISDLGHVRSYRTNGGKIAHAPHMLKIRPVKGYPQVHLMGPAGPLEVKVHRAVLEAFVGPCPEGMQGCHNDGNPLNSVLTNLRRDTPEANREDRRKHGKQMGVPGERHYRARFTEADIRCIRAEPYYVGVVRMLAEAFDVAPQTIKKIHSRKAWKHVPQYL